MGVQWDKDPLRQPLPRAVVPRPGLQRTLDRIGPGGLGLLVASAGSGKSVLVRQWATECRPELRTAALALTPAHDDAVVLARELLEALRGAAPQVAPSIGDLVEMGRSALGDPFVDALLGELAMLPHATVLVLEDLHLLTNAALVDDVGRLLTRLPRTTRCIVTTRQDPPWSLRQMRLDGRLVEVRGAELAFTAREARQLLEAVSDRELTDRDVALLLDRTDGWAVGLQLAAVSLRDVSDIGAAVDSFAGSDRLVGEYLLEEVLAQQDPETRAFLLETSVLDWMSVDLCNAVTGTDNARAMLDDLEKRSLFVTSLDRSGELFRYHHLFADLLRYQLRIEDPSAAPEVHTRAARWLLDHGFPEDAVEHLLCAGEHQQAFAVVTSVAHLLFERGESATLVRWLTTIDGAALDTPPEVGVNLLAAQVAADQSDAASETHRRLLKRPDLTPGQRASADALHTTLVFRGLPPEVVLTAASGVLEVLPTLDAADVVDFLGIGGLESVRVMAEYDAAIARFLQGDLVGAASALEHVLTLPGLEYPIWKIYTLGSLALVRAWTGHCTEALQLADAAIRTGRAIGVAGHASQIHAHMAIGLVHLDQADLDAAARSLAESDRQNRRRPSSVVNRDLQRTLVARLTAVTEGTSRALAILRQPAESAVLPPVLRDADRALEVRLLIGSGDTLGARTVLTRLGHPAELVAAHVDVALAANDLAAAQEALDRWQPPQHDLRTSIGHGLRHAVVLDRAADQSAAHAVLRKAAAMAEGERLRWPFLEVPAALRMLLREPGGWPSSTAAALLPLALLLEPRERAQERLIDPLSERELAVLDYLPRRIKNQDIAAELYVTVNTIKTHLRSIYSKLGVDNRDEAINRATELGLL
jgi:LuxR family maltose regulon positive regulatory protein